jgi:hypothetical protein
MLAGRPLTDVNDVWPLLAVAYAGDNSRGADLATIRFVAGLIRRATFADEELRAALGRLRAAGYIDERDGKYCPVEPVLTFFRTRTHRRGVWHDREELIRFLGVAPTSPRTPCPASLDDPAGC